MNLKIIDNDYFSVIDEKGNRQVYTYNPKISSENDSVKLIAKSSDTFNEMVKEIKNKGSYSYFSINYSYESVESAISKKSCCDLCPFTSVCEDQTGCCHFCSNYEVCNSQILNGKLVKLGEIKKQKNLKLILFIYDIAISNDYLIEQNTKKQMAIIFDYKTNRPIGDIVLNDFETLEISESKEDFSIDKGAYNMLYEKSFKLIQEKTSGYLNMLKQQIQDPLTEKIKSIIDMYYTEYSSNYTKTKVSRIEELQNEAYRFSKREIDGYGINIEYRLKNVYFIDTKRDIRELVFDVSGKKRVVEADILLNRIDIYCEHCGREIEKAYICDEGHVICDTCASICKDCGKVFCPICENEQFHCSTCGESFCSECINHCDICDSYLCKNHTYECDFCNNNTCIDCYEICSICGKNICYEHLNYCSECEKPLCLEHSIRCEECGEYFCPEHINNCAICKKNLCDKHINYSEYDSLPLCNEHIHTCTENQITVSSKNSKSCPSCSSRYCNNIEFIKCNLSGLYFCKKCINENGYSKVFENLKSTEKKNLKYQNTDFNKYTSFMQATGDNVVFILATKPLGDDLYIYQNDVLTSKISIPLSKKMILKMKGVL